MKKKYILKVFPVGAEREVYQVIEIFGDHTLDDLCGAILSAFDFIDEHLYEFCMDNRMYSDYSYQSAPKRGEPSTRVDIFKTLIKTRCGSYINIIRTATRLLIISLLFCRITECFENNIYKYIFGESRFYTKVMLIYKHVPSAINVKIFTRIRRTEISAFLRLKEKFDKVKGE